MSPEATILKALIQHAPAIASAVREFAGVHGIDLGPAPPDLKRDASGVDAEIDRRLAEQEAKRAELRAAGPFTLDADDTEDPDE